MVPWACQKSCSDHRCHSGTIRSLVTALVHEPPGSGGTLHAALASCPIVFLCRFPSRPGLARHSCYSSTHGFVLSSE